MWECGNVETHSFHVSTFPRLFEGGKSFPPFLLYMTEKFKNCVETAEIMINYAENIIDLATELQYLLIEQEGVKQDKQSNSLKEVPELRICGSEKERAQIFEKEMGANISVQKLYVPVFKLSTKNVRTAESIEDTQTQREDNQLTTD